MTKLKIWLARRKIYRQTFKELNQLTDYELSDLGLNRGTVYDVAHEAAYGKEFHRV